MVKFKITIYRENTLQLHKQRENDTTIMGHMIKSKLITLELKQINTCRMHTKVIFLSDIVGTDRRTIINECFTEKIHDNRLTWPNIPHPPLLTWKTWTKYIKKCFVKISQTINYVNHLD